VLGALERSSPRDPAWGYRICEETGLSPGAVYPVLERLEAAGHLRGYLEAPLPPGRPARRFYELTGTGRELAERVQAAPVRWSPVSGRGLRPALVIAAGLLLRRR
jgi:PadR family transcriptional regulator PadR